MCVYIECWNVGRQDKEGWNLDGNKTAYEKTQHAEIQKAASMQGSHPHPYRQGCTMRNTSPMDVDIPCIFDGIAFFN